jgi:hypothetical protein
MDSLKRRVLEKDAFCIHSSSVVISAKKEEAYTHLCHPLLKSTRPPRSLLSPKQYPKSHVCPLILVLFVLFLPPQREITNQSLALCSVNGGCYCMMWPLWTSPSNPTFDVVA